VALRILSDGGSKLESVAVIAENRCLKVRNAGVSCLKAPHFEMGLQVLENTPSEADRECVFDINIDRAPVPILVIAPGFLPQQLVLAGSMTVTLQSAPKLTMGLIAGLPMPNRDGRTLIPRKLAVQLVPEDENLRDHLYAFTRGPLGLDHPAIHVRLDLVNLSNSVEVPHFGPGVYRITATAPWPGAFSEGSLDAHGQVPLGTIRVQSTGGHFVLNVDHEIWRKLVFLPPIEELRHEDPGRIGRDP
jgi:hypothetical protein